MSFFETDPTSTFDTPLAPSTHAPKRHAVVSPSYNGSSAAQRRGIDASSPRTDFSDQQLRDAMQCVAEAIAPVWPLKDYVAVNPYLGLTERPFLSARQWLRSVSDCEMLMPLEYYREQFDNGALQETDIKAAMQQIQQDHSLFRITPADVLDQLTPVTTTVSAHAASYLHAKRMRSVADVADNMDNTDWSNLIREEIGKHCAAYYDEGQAVWPSPWQHLPLFQAWRSAAQQDRRFELLGATGFCRFVASLPHTPGAAIAFLLKVLQVPAELWESFLYCQALSIPGWSAWARYQSRQEPDCADGEHFEALLAMRIAYDVGVAKATGLTIDWKSVSQVWTSAGRATSAVSETDALVRFTLLRASELAYQRRLLGSLSRNKPPVASAPVDQPLAQIVFCIDVRSERYRRNLETISTDVQTFGFAGFFGIPMAFQALGEATTSPQVPALLAPAFTVRETLRGVSQQESTAALERQGFRRTLHACWKQFQSSAVSCFGFVETSGLAYGWKLFSRSMQQTPSASQNDRGAIPSESKTGPDLADLDRQGITIDQQVDIAESMLRGIGITSQFAKLVVLCGHASTTQNNPLQAGLDCGACCGHSGEPNARFAAQLLNQPQVRGGLQQRGISVPDQTRFVAAVHNTTSDEIRFCDTDRLSQAARCNLEQLKTKTAQATTGCQLERLPKLAASDPAALLTRTRDWSEVRPEWGLAGNAAFIVAPRAVTRNVHLDGRSFLHSYDHRNDHDFQVLEQIMTAPMVVAHWINMQYYASTVDHKHYGSGSKTIHNVVGRFGVFSGNGGDLMTGLPWQSLHDGTSFQHEPLRLLSVIAAPREAVADIIQRHKLLSDLLANDWLNLVVLEDGHCCRYTTMQTWERVETEFSELVTHEESHD